MRRLRAIARDQWGKPALTADSKDSDALAMALDHAYNPADGSLILLGGDFDDFAVRE